jgi:hypothetical protein
VRAAWLLLSLAACRPEAKPRPLLLDGSLTDSAPLSTATLHGHPSVVALWLPG